MQTVKRVIFVGENNKPGFKPLDSFSRSGAIIDVIIKRVEELKPADVELKIDRTNLYDIDYWPTAYNEIYPFAWPARVGHKDGDIIVALGSKVQRRFFTYGWGEFISVKHPASRDLFKYQDRYDYIVQVAHLIVSRL